MSHRPTPSFPIDTERLTLRLYRDGDDVWMHAIYAQPDVVRYLLDEPWNEAFARNRLADRLAKTDLDGDLGTLALVIERDGTPIGDIMIWLSDQTGRAAEIGWVLDPAYGGKGYAAEAVRRVIDLGFGEYGLHRIVAQMDARNAASAKLAGRLGLRQEAHFLQNWWSKGQWTDTLVFAALGSEWGGDTAPGVSG